jgi:hypothetical protein
MRLIGVEVFEISFLINYIQKLLKLNSVRFLYFCLSHPHAKGNFVILQVTIHYIYIVFYIILSIMVSYTT